MNKVDPLEKLKSSLLGIGSSSYIKTFKYFEDFKDSFAKNCKFLGYLRFLEYKTELSFIAQNYLIPPVSELSDIASARRKLVMPPISTENEQDMLVKLIEIATKCLKKYPQTYEEDAKLLENKDLTFNERNCIVYRSGEKKIYKDMIEMANLGILLLSMDYEKAETYYKKLGKEPIYSAYITQVLLPFIKTNTSE